MIRVQCPPGRAAARQWVAEVVLGDLLGQACRLDAQPGATHWTLSLDGEPGALVMPDLLLGVDDALWLSAASLPRQPLAQWMLPAGLRHTAAVPAELPVLYGAPVSADNWLTAEGAAPATGPTQRLGLDIFGSALFLLARYEEYATTQRGEYDWFPLEHSALYQAGALERPLVNEYAELLWKLLRRLWPGLARPPRSARVRPTHDVDWPWDTYHRGWPRVWRRALGDIVQRADPALAWRRLATAGRVLHGAIDLDVNNTFGWLMDESERRGLTSTFYFLIDDARFTIEHPWIFKLLHAIDTRGHRIGVHPPLDTARDPAALTVVVERFRATLHLAGLSALAGSALPGRQHYLQWEPAETWPAYCAAGLGSDSSCGFPQRIGFRAGVGQPYPAFDLRSLQRLPLTEEPLLAMEASLLGAMFEGLPLPRAAERMIALGRVCRAFGGDFVLLWHNDGLISRRQQAAYRAVLDGAM